MAASEIFHVAIAPSDRLDESLIKQVAAIVDKDFYETYLILAGRIPQIIAHYDTAEMAELTTQSLQGLGLVVIVCEDSKIRQSSPKSYRAHTMKFEEQAILFWDKSGQEKRIESRDVFLIIKGRIQTRTETDIKSKRMKFSLPATVLTGMPIWREVKENTSVKSVKTELFMRLYNRTSPEPKVEIFQYDFDYSLLDAEMAPTSLANFGILVMRIRDTFPQAVFDDRLTAPFAIDIPPTAPRDRVEIDCKLLYLYHQSVSNPGSST